jgi:hypothetical protein
MWGYPNNWFNRIHLMVPSECQVHARAHAYGVRECWCVCLRPRGGPFYCFAQYRFQIRHGHVQYQRGCVWPDISCHSSRVDFCCFEAQVGPIWSQMQAQLGKQLRCSIWSIPKSSHLWEVFPYIYIYIYIHIDTHTYTRDWKWTDSWRTCQAEIQKTDVGSFHW